EQSFGPVWSLQITGIWDNDAVDGAVAIDSRGVFDRTVRFYRLNHEPRRAELFRAGIELVHVETFALPVFMEKQRKIDRTLLAQPLNMRANFRLCHRQIIAVEIDSGRVDAGSSLQSGRIDRGTDMPMDVIGQPGFKQLEDGQRTGRFVAMDARGKINRFGTRSSASGKCEYGHAVDFRKRADREAAFSGGSAQIIDQGLDRCHFPEIGHRLKQHKEKLARVKRRKPGEG